MVNMLVWGLCFALEWTRGTLSTNPFQALDGWNPAPLGMYKTKTNEPPPSTPIRWIEQQITSWTAVAGKVTQCQKHLCEVGTHSAFVPCVISWFIFSNPFPSTLFATACYSYPIDPLAWQLTNPNLKISRTRSGRVMWDFITGFNPGKGPATSREIHSKYLKRIKRSEKKTSCLFIFWTPIY